MGKELDLRKAVLQVAKNRAYDERHQARLADQVTYKICLVAAVLISLVCRGRASKT